MTLKNTVLTVLGIGSLAVSLAGCQADETEGGDVQYSPVGYQGAGNTAWTGGIATATGGAFTQTGGIATETGGFQPETGGLVTQTGGMVAETGGMVAETGGMVAETGGMVAETGGMVAETGGMVAETGGTMGGGAVSSMTFTVTTKSQGGKYSPRNVAAIWVEDSSGKFVRALARYALIRARYLTKYNSASSGTAVPVDAMTGATLSRHQTHTVTWNMTDAAGSPVSPGDYKIFVEVTEKDGTGANTSVSFSTASGPGEMSFSDEQFYTGMKVTLK